MRIPRNTTMKTFVIYQYLMSPILMFIKVYRILYKNRSIKLFCYSISASNMTKKKENVIKSNKRKTYGY